jgi:hypothetical protein
MATNTAAGTGHIDARYVADLARIAVQRDR